MRAEVVTVNFTPQTAKTRERPNLPEIPGMSAKERERLLSVLATSGPQTIEGMARKATATIGGRRYNLYLPPGKTYSKTNTAKSDQSFSNTATMLYTDHDGNSNLEEWERRPTNLPMRFGQKMYDVTALSADGRSMTLTESRAPLAQLLVGQPAPPLVFKATNGKFIDLAALRGKSVVLDVWSFTWHSCVEEFPQLKQIARKLGPARYFYGMLCVDEGYFGGQETKMRQDVDSCLKKYSMTEFLNVMMPAGFDSVVRKTGKDGYGLMVINPKGIVVSMNAYATTLPGLLPELF